MTVRGLVVCSVLVAIAAAGCGSLGDTDRRLRVPAALPADVPLPENAVLRASRDLGGKGLNLVFETDEPAAAVQGRLRARLEAGGWSLLSEVALEDAVFTSYRKAGRSVAVGVSRTGAVTQVGLAYHQPNSGREGGQG